ncbi:MAG: hypothetical protein IT519_16800 [Burkholderiales bacterium]|nr:hypothetical protein [Burkholderiales bacterium]
MVFIVAFRVARSYRATSGGMGARMNHLDRQMAFGEADREIVMHVGGWRHGGDVQGSAMTKTEVGRCRKFVAPKAQAAGWDDESRSKGA